jgi:acetyl-CoA carboxylase carboxyltransferase component
MDIQFWEMKMISMGEKLAEKNTAKERARSVGGTAAAEKQHREGKLTARERVEMLLDPGSFQELDLLRTSAEDSLNNGIGGIPTDGVITGYGEVSGRPIFVWAQDAAVMGGSVGVVHAQKITAVMEKALQARVPVVGIIDSVGERPGDLLQYPYFYSLESIAKSQTLASGVIPQINLIMGPCIGSMALCALMGDFVFLVQKTSYMHIAPAPEGKSSEEVGEAWMHARKTGCYDVFAASDEDCLRKCRKLLDYLPKHNREKPPFKELGDDPNRREEELLELVPVNESKPFNMSKLISLIVDKGEFFEIRKHWASNLIVGFARMGGCCRLHCQQPSVLRRLHDP